MRNQEEIKEQEKLDLGPTVPLPEVPQPVPSPSAGGVLNWENSAKEGAQAVKTLSRHFDFTFY